MFKSWIWKFDMIIYRLFYWRWKQRLIENDDIRRLFLQYLQAWETISNEPAMGIGTPPKFPFPDVYER